MNKRYKTEKKNLEEKVVAVRREGRMKVVDLEKRLAETRRTVEKLELSLVALSSFEEESNVSAVVGIGGCCRGCSELWCIWASGSSCLWG